LKFHLVKLPEHPDGYVNVSNSAAAWESWIRKSLPAGLAQEVQKRLVSNLKHILVALEMKSALIVPHAKRGQGKPLLFESYFHMLNFEFCVGVFSVCEGLGSALWLKEKGEDGSTSKRVAFEDWKIPLSKKFDPESKFSLSSDIETVRKVRDRLHQDQVGARENIDWHDFSYDKAYVPAACAIRCLLRTNAGDVPRETNLTAE
jgi:hypothetical protein